MNACKNNDIYKIIIEQYVLLSWRNISYFLLKVTINKLFRSITIADPRFI